MMETMGDSANDNTSDEKASCGGCYFFEDDSETMSRGNCHRYPVVVSKDKKDFCGEFKLKPGPKPFDNNASLNNG